MKQLIKTATSWLKSKLMTFIDHAEAGFSGGRSLFRRPTYIAVAVVSFLAFVFFFNFFRDGFGNFSLLLSNLSLRQKLDTLGLVAMLFFDDFKSLYGLGIILLSLIQGINIAFLLFVFRQKRKDEALDGLSLSSIASILGLISLGCPTCGISLLAPLLSVVAGSSAVIFVTRIGSVIGVLAFLLSIYALVDLSYSASIILSAERYKKKHEKGN